MSACNGNVHQFTAGPADAFPWRCLCGARTANRVDGVFKVFATPGVKQPISDSDLDFLERDALACGDVLRHGLVLRARAGDWSAIDDCHVLLAGGTLAVLHDPLPGGVA